MAAANVIPASSKPFTSNTNWSFKKEKMSQGNRFKPDTSHRPNLSTSTDSLSESEDAATGYTRQRNGDENKIFESDDGIQIVELTCSHPDAGYQDLLGLRLSGSRSSGVFVQSVQARSPAAKLGQIHPNDQLLQVENISLIGLTPDQVVRVIRTAISIAGDGTIRLITARSWADPNVRHFRPLSPRSLPRMVTCRSEGTLASGLSSLSIDMENSPLPNVTNDDTSRFIVAPKASSSTYPIIHQHELKRQPVGAVKVKKSSVDQSALNGAKSHANTGMEAFVNTPPNHVTELIMEMGKNQSGHVNEKTKIARRFIDECNKEWVNQQLPGTLQGNIDTDLRRRRKMTETEDHGSPMRTSQSWACTMISRKCSQSEEIRGKFHPKKSLNAEESMKPISCPEKKDAKHRYNDNETGDVLPLVSFDHLARAPPSPAYSKSSDHNSSSGQSKCSKGSVESSGRSSQGSQKLSWQCPVCLDGASRVRRTRRRMMSTCCGHVFCNSCMEDVVKKYQICPKCRASITSMDDVHPIYM